MKSFIKICYSIIRKNKGFTIGIFIMSVLSVAIAFLGANFGASSSDTVMGFISGSGTPDAVFMTDVMPDAAAEPIRDIDGVDSVFPGFIYDTNITTEDGSLFSVRVFRRSAASPFVHTVQGQFDGEISGPAALISSEFAEHNGIRAGDRITVDTPVGKASATVRAIVSNPETLSCVRDEMSAYEDYRFGYVYFDDDDFDSMIPVKGSANQWLVYFDEGLSKEEEKKLTEDIRDEFGTHCLSASYTDESEGLRSIRDDLHTIGVLCSFIPGIIWLISLGFSFIFIKIIIENQRKTIGLLRALGFSIRKVVLLFVCYTLLINLPALLCGIPLGDQLLRICLGVMAAAEGISESVVTIRFGLTSVMMLSVLAIGVIAALLSARTIAGIDPSEAYGGMEASSFEPPEWVGRVRTNAFFKISLISILRNSKRQIIGALCIAACVISMCIGFEGTLTIGHPIDAVYGGRYCYDLMVRSLNDSDYENIAGSVRGIDRIEPMTFFSAELLGKDVRVSTVEADSELVILADASGKNLLPGDGVIVDEMFAEINGVAVGDTVELSGCPLSVTGIAREILFPVIYISPQTAERMGHETVNGVLLRLEPGTESSDVERQITEICSGAYFAEFASQKENIRNGFIPMRLIMLIFAVLAFCIGSLLVLNMTIIDFNENRLRYATLRAIGTPVGRLAVISAVQNLFRVIAGVILACPLCYVCVTILLKLLSGALQQYVMVDYMKCLILSCLIPFLYVLFGIGLTLRRIAEMDLCSYLNEVE